MPRGRVSRRGAREASPAGKQEQRRGNEQRDGEQAEHRVGRQRPRSRRTKGWRALRSTRSAPSATPCTRVRSARARPRVRRADPATNPRFHPYPSRKSAIVSSAPPSGGASAASTAATARVPRPAAMTRGLPNRSVRRPVIGDRANMPNVWADSTSPTVSSPCPWSLRCSGVMVMIRTITTWPATIVTSATRTAGYRKRTPSPGAGPASLLARRADWSARRYGSGRRKTNAIANDRLMKTNVSRYAPARAGSPSASREHSRRRDEVGTGDRTDRRAPHHGADRRRASFGDRRIGRDIAPELPGAVRKARHGAAEQEERERSDQDRREGDEAAERPTRDADQHPRPPADAQHEDREEACGRCRPDRRGRRRQPARRCGPGHLRRHERAGRDRGDVPGRPEGRDGEQGPDHPAAQCRQPCRIDLAGRPHDPRYRSRKRRRTSPPRRCSAAASRPIHR